MLIFNRSSAYLSENETISESHYRQRRLMLKSLGLVASSIALPTALPANAGLLDSLLGETPKDVAQNNGQALKYQAAKNGDGLSLTDEHKIISHNNYYEFGTSKTDPLKNAQNLKVDPWSIEVSGEVAKPGKIDIADLLSSSDLVERIYRMRCVEAWSMVIPWVGIELGKILKRFEPTSKAKYVAFQTLHDPEQMPGQRSRFVGGGIDYPYVEGLRLDEAMHSLTLLAVGVYGKALPPQNGAPVRLVVPWKYGFKGIKSIVKISLVEKMPATSWNRLAPQEYGFYANVNPKVDHPRWSQASERFIGSGGPLQTERKATLMFNGYAEQVASLYKGMDLSKHY